MNNIHGTLISYKNKGVLIIGKSGTGKSDLALRGIIDYGTKLVADDRVILNKKGNEIYGTAPKELSNKLEIRGLGIAQIKTKKTVKINLVVELCNNITQIERLPLEDKTILLDVEIPKIKLYPFESSAFCKIIAKISSNFSFI